MIGAGFFTFLETERTRLSFRIKESNKEDFLPIVREWEKLSPEEVDSTEYEFTLHVTGIVDYMKNGEVDVRLTRTPDIIMERKAPFRSSQQHRTLRGLEHFMFWAQHGRRPIGDEAEPYHAALLEMFAPIVRTANPLVPGEIVVHRKSTSEMNTKEMSVMVDGALAMLMEMDIPKKVTDTIGKPMADLWHAWYEWKNKTRSLLGRDDGITWDKYRAIYPYCELCGKGGREGDPLERMHIVSGGSSIENYEESWNWLHAHHSHHVRQHGTVEEQKAGWNLILSDFPHIKGRVERAFTLAGKKVPKGAKSVFEEE